MVGTWWILNYITINILKYDSYSRNTATNTLLFCSWIREVKTLGILSHIYKMVHHWHSSWKSGLPGWQFFFLILSYAVNKYLIYPLDVRFLFINLYLHASGNENVRARSYLPINFPQGCDSWDWARLKSRAKNSIWILHWVVGTQVHEEQALAGRWLWSQINC